MKYSPPTGGSRLTVAAVLLLVSAALVFMLPSVPGVERAIPRPIVQFAAVILAVVGIFLLVRFRFVTFTYAVTLREIGVGSDAAEAYENEGDVTRIPPSLLDFTVTKAQGRRPAYTECVLSLGDLRRVLRFAGRRDASNALRKELKITKYYDYTSSPNPQKVTVLVFEDGADTVAISAECDDGMHGALSSLCGTNNGQEETEI